MSEENASVATEEDIRITYYCRECSKVVLAKSQGRKKKYTFKCPDCKNICAYGTSRGIVSFFRIKEGSESWNIMFQSKEEE